MPNQAIRRLAFAAALAGAFVAATLQLAGSAAGGPGSGPRLLVAGPSREAAAPGFAAAVTVSPDGDGLNDLVHLRVGFASAGQARIESFVWGGRDAGWRPLARSAPVDVSAGDTSLAWGARNKLGGFLRDGSYVITACRTDASSAVQPSPAGAVRPGPAERTLTNQPWARDGCLSAPVVVRVRRLSAGVAAAGSFVPGSSVPLEIGTDKEELAFRLERDGAAGVFDLHERRAGPRIDVRLPEALRPALYHLVVSDDRGAEQRVPIVIRATAFRAMAGPLRAALVVWPYLTWRAYNVWDENRDGRPDTWYQFWRQRRVTLAGPLLPAGQEDDHQAALPFSRWLAAHPSYGAQHITDVELADMRPAELARYSALIFPGHTEYYTPRLYDHVRDYRDRGGNVVFLQANPFYRQVRIDRAANAVVMEDLDARGTRSDFALAGVGYDGCCFLRARWAPYAAAKRDFPKVAWLFARTGLGPGESFGRAGIEDDRTDPALTPRDHVVAATALIRGNHGLVRSEMVYSRVPGGGSVFATGNYQFLRMGQRTPSGESLPAVMLDNIWRRFVSLN